MNADRTTFEDLLRQVGQSDIIYPAAQSVLGIIELERELGSLIIREKTMPAERTAGIYRSRFQNLSRKGIRCGGFPETTDSLTSYARPVRAISCETKKFIIICFADDSLRKLIGCVYSERQD